MKLHDTWQDSLNFTMDSLLVGTGWYEVEKQRNIYFRWTGPGTKSTIHLYPQRNTANRLNLTIHSAVSEGTLTGLKIEADGILLHTTLSTKRNPAFVTAVLPLDNSRVENERTILTFHLPDKSTGTQFSQNSINNRPKGIALRNISITPLSRPLFIAKKYNDPVPFDGLHYIHHNKGVSDAVINGSYSSAYDYFKKHDRAGASESFELHENFDECPGDLFDILSANMREQSRKQEERYQEEINLLRDIVYRQGDALRALKGQNNGTK